MYPGLRGSIDSGGRMNEAGGRAERREGGKWGANGEAGCFFFSLPLLLLLLLRYV